MEEQEQQYVGGQVRPEGLLYHYTGQNGLLGILGSKSIWATHVRYLNDTSEFVSAWDKLWDALLEKIRQSDFPDKNSSFKQSLEKVFRGFRQGILKDPRGGAYYVLCFTDDRASRSHDFGFDGDRLSQWRGYSKGGNGFSIGFDADALLGSFTASGNVAQSFKPCEYSESVQEAQIEELANKHLEGFLHAWSTYFSELRDPSLSTSENLKNNGEHLLGPIMNMYADFVEFGMFMKHHGFREEDEWRATFVAENQAMCSFRESIFGLTPYLAIGLDLSKSPTPLKRIVVGPGLHKEEWVQTVSLLLAKCEISGVEVVPSKIPYRNW